MSDADLIDSLGGPTRVAQLLAWTDAGAVQRVSNWKRRGIPPRVRLDYPAVFAAEAAPAAPPAAAGTPAIPSAEPSMWPLITDRRIEPREPGPVKAVRDAA